MIFNNKKIDDNIANLSITIEDTVFNLAIIVGVSGSNSLFYLLSNERSIVGMDKTL